MVSSIDPDLPFPFKHIRPYKSLTDGITFITVDVAMNGKRKRKRKKYTIAITQEEEGGFSARNVMS